MPVRLALRHLALGAPRAPRAPSWAPWAPCRVLGGRRFAVDSAQHKQEGQAETTGCSGPSYMHRPARDPLLYLSFGQLVERTAARYGDRDAVVAVEEGVRLTYRDLLQQADRFAAGLRRLGLQPGDRVAIWGPNRWRWIVTKVAVARAGLVSVDMNPLYREREVQHCLSVARVAAVVAADKYRDVVYHDVLSAVAPELRHRSPGGIQSAALPDLRAVISMADRAPPGWMEFEDVSSQDVSELQALVPRISPDAGSYIQFSSGTTGKPKAIVLSHRGVVNNGFFVGKRFGLHEKHHVICVQPPLFHVYGSVVIMSSAMNHGATMVLPTTGYNPKKALAAAISERCTMMTGTPTMYVDLVRAAEEEGVSLGTVELASTGGAPIPPEFVRRLKATLGVKRLCSVYGLSETTAVIFQGTPTDSDDQVAETVGQIGEHVEAKVVDGEGQMVPFGTPGELWLRGYFAMNEYFENEEETKKTIVNGGWVRTGDKFVLQSDGYGRIVGRIKDMIIRGGENIYPKEVEDIIITHPDIREAEVVGVPDERMGEELCACLRVRDGAQVSAADLRTFLKGSIASYKIPRYCVTLPDFPKTLSGKIQKFKLRDDCARLLADGQLDDCKNKM